MQVSHSAGRFYIKTGHGDAELLYRVEGGVVSMYHTFVPDEERGKGLAEEMADAAFTFAREKGLKVRPDCSYIVHYLETHKGMQRYAVSP